MKVNFFHNSLLIFFISNCYFCQNVNINNQFQFELINRYKKILIKSEHVKYKLISTTEYYKLPEGEQQNFKFIPCKKNFVMFVILLVLNIIGQSFCCFISYYILFHLKPENNMDIMQLKILCPGVSGFIMLIVYILGFFIIKKFYQKKSINFYYFSNSMNDNVTLLQFLTIPMFIYFIFFFIGLSLFYKFYPKELALIIKYNISELKKMSRNDDVSGLLNRSLDAPTMPNSEEVKNTIKIIHLFSLIFLYIIPLVIYVGCGYLIMEMNPYYMYNEKNEYIWINEAQLKGFSVLIPYLIKNNKTIFDLVDDDPEVLKLLNS